MKAKMAYSSVSPFFITFGWNLVTPAVSLAFSYPFPHKEKRMRFAIKCLTMGLLCV